MCVIKLLTKLTKCFKENASFKVLRQKKTFYRLKIRIRKKFD